MTRPSTWILVADAGKARLFRQGKRHLVLLKELEHNDSRARVRDLMSDANGRKPNGQPGHATGHRPGAEPDTDPKEVEAQKFARELCALLQEGLNDHAWERVVLVAPPHFLGLLRGAVSDQVGKRVELCVGKDYTGLAEQDLEAHLEAAVTNLP